MNQVVLFARAAEAVTLQEAVTQAAAALRGDGAPVAILYTPRQCRLAVLTPEGELRGPAGLMPDLSEAFEARVFSGQGELRWLHQADGRGRAVLLSEQDISRYLAEPVPDLTTVAIKDHEYLLWGKGTGASPAAGWSRLSAARIGTLDVPVPDVKDGESVCLRAREYLALAATEGEEDHGNVAVLEERLLGMGVR